MHAAGVRLVSGSDGGIAAAKPHGLLPVSLAFLVEGGMSTVAALASATALAADACGLGDRKGRLRAGYDADLLVVDGDPVADIGALARPVAVFAAGRQLNRAGPWPFRMVEELPWPPARACGCRAGDREQFT
jgi:imidazolonepropionase-like amidohydrolase